jgi:hydrogenase maturation factor HypF (carbamoyltransferase family)
VYIEIDGLPKVLEAFTSTLETEAPVLSKIVTIKTAQINPQRLSTFEIIN